MTALRRIMVFNLKLIIIQCYIRVHGVSGRRPLKRSANEFFIGIITLTDVEMNY